MRCLGHAAGVSSQPIHVQLGLDLESCLARALLRNNLNECFRKCRIKRSKGILQQDGATCHTAKIIGKYLILVAEPGQHWWPRRPADNDSYLTGETTPTEQHFINLPTPADTYAYCNQCSNAILELSFLLFHTSFAWDRRLHIYWVKLDQMT